ncbi:MAG: hypothetical protein D6705_17400 [Deltaproteobacteria bacterium]|nr:MAG: hypothetical protein D6705_17400 [Deltaproteobacteria bacterium]
MARRSAHSPVPCTLLVLALACNGGDTDESTGASGTASTAGSTSTGTTATSSGASSGQGGSTAATATSGTATSTSATDTTGGTTTTGPKFDLGGGPDAPPPPACTTGKIPATCAEAEACPTSVGCRFYAVDLDQLDGGDDHPYAVAVSNVQSSSDVVVSVEQKMGGAWQVVAGPVTIPALDLHVFELPDLHQEGSGMKAGGAYRVTADAPVAAYQMNPLNIQAGIASSDATMLYPVTTWDDIYHVVGWEPYPHTAYVTVAAAVDGTTVQFETAAPVTAGPGVPASMPGDVFTVDLDEGDVVEIMTQTNGVTFTGTRISSDPDHPIAVFSGAECTFVLAYSCDHVETQLSGLRLWGKQFVAARVPPRTTPPETSVFQIYASEDGTTVTFDAPPEVTGLPAAPAALDAGEVLTLEVGGTAAVPGDFVVTADKPIAIANYMTGSSLAGSIGDPAMVQLPPVEQFLPRYVVLVPPSWNDDRLVLVRPADTGVTVDGTPVDPAAFVTAGAGFEVARIQVTDGVHVVEGDAPVGVVVVGVTSVDSYAYLGGVGAEVINPTPEG